ncbi:MAG: lipocalin-like domain-containing protein, partial [Bacteroidota bacterium]|nr:lipocalin-like domain-containing protein [Bacteroidota bacterium]
MRNKRHISRPWKTVLPRHAAMSLLLVLFLTGCGNNDRTSDESDGLALSALSNPDTVGYARAYAPRDFVFPADDGPHPEFKTEWWYWTGNLSTADGRRFGYQFTIFRNALAPDLPAGNADSADWRSRQLYFAHFALSDIDGERFHAFERFSRGAAGLAGAQALPFRVWVEDWQASGTPDSVRIIAEESGIGIDLTLIAAKERVLQGDRGLSRKSAAAGNASYYYSRTRLDTRGTLRCEDGRFDVKGLSWLDREWSTSVLSRQQSGWDWFSLQFDDGSEVMLYQLRLGGGEADTTSSGIIVRADGSTRRLAYGDFEIRAREEWTS